MLLGIINGIIAGILASIISLFAGNEMSYLDYYMIWVAGFGLGLLLIFISCFISYAIRSEV
jgi:hypothetical protein